MKNQKGFTLIELLLVLAIIGIISAIAIPALLGQRERAKAKAVQGNMDACAGEVARINDTLKENGSNPTASQVVTSMLLLSNYMTPNAVNPYDGKTPAFVTAKTSTGQVLLSAGTVVDSATGMSYSGVNIIGYYLDGGTEVSRTKVVALD